MIPRLLAGLACLLLSACFEIREELWVRPDGSARAELSYVVPSSVAKMAGGEEGLEAKIREGIMRQPKLQLEGVSVQEEEGQTKVHLRISTESVYSLRTLDDGPGFQSMPAAAVDMAGKFEVQTSGWNVDFSRTIRMREALGLASMGIRGEDRKTRRLVYIVHLPTPAIETNATKIEDGGRTLTWDSTLGEALQKPLVTRFKARMPIPRNAWIAAGLIGTAFIGLLLRIHVLRRRRRSA